MPFVAEAWLTIDAPPEVVFDTLADHQGWERWMPRSFAVAGRPTSPHHAGKRFGVRIVGLPFASSLEVTVMDRPRALGWRGGMPGVLQGNHEFRIHGDGKGGSRVQSHEIWSGALARLLRPVLKPAAERLGGEQLAGLASACLARREVST